MSDCHQGEGCFQDYFPEMRQEDLYH